MNSVAGVFCCCCGKKTDGGGVKYTAAQPDEERIDRSPPDQTSHLASHEDTTLTTEPVIHPQPMPRSHPSVGESSADRTSQLTSRDDTSPTTDPVIHPLPIAHSHQAAVQTDKESLGPSPRDQTSHLASHEDTTLTTDPVIHTQPMAHSHPAAVQPDKESIGPSPREQTSHLATHEDTTLTTDPVVIHTQPMAHSYQAGGGASELHKIFRHVQRSKACDRWRDLGRELGLEEWVFLKIAHKYQRDIMGQLYEMLLEWEQSRGEHAQLDLLVAALRRCGLNKVAEDLLKAFPSLTSGDPQIVGEHIEQIRTELRAWYVDSLSRLHPIPWCHWVESDFTHMFTNLEIVPGRKHQRPMQSSRLPNLGSSAPPQGPSRAIDTEERLVESLWGSGGRTVSFIEGTAGMGKSCLCRRLVLSWANKTLSVLREKFTLMLILEARTLKRSLKDCITRQLFAEDFALTSDDINQCVTQCQEKCLFIIDGVDELTCEGKQVVQELLGGTLFRRANVLLTGRPESAERYIKHVNIHFRIRGFTLENAKLYIRKFFDDNQFQVRDKIIDRIEGDGNLVELSQTPFTTLLMCLLAEDSGGDIPNTRNGIMKDIVQLTARRYVSRPKSTSTEDTTVEAILRAAAQVAYKGETTGTVVFEESDLETICTHEMSDHLLLSGLFYRDFILSRLDTKGCCSFPHKSIQDFLCARHLADLDVHTLKTTLARRFLDNPTLGEMLLNMLRDQADKYRTAMTFYWSVRFRECIRAVVRSALTVTDSRTLDTIIGVFWQYRSVHSLRDILRVPGGGRLYSLVVCRILPVIMSEAVRIGQNTWRVYIQGTDWSSYSRTTPDRGCVHDQRVHLPVTCVVSLPGYTIRDEVWQDLTLPWVLTSLRDAIDLTERPVRINVLCVCVIPTAECITSLSSLIDRPRASDLIVFILKPRALTYEDSVYLRVLEMCKRAHSKLVRVSSCTVLTEVETRVHRTYNEIDTYHKLSTSPLQIHYNRHCPY